MKEEELNLWAMRFTQVNYIDRSKELLIEVLDQQTQAKDKEIEELKEEILDIINSENSGLSHQQRLNEIENLLNQRKDENN